LTFEGACKIHTTQKNTPKDEMQLDKYAIKKTKLEMLLLFA
jgi:hypothetical protein